MKDYIRQKKIPIIESLFFILFVGIFILLNSSEVIFAKSKWKAGGISPTGTLDDDTLKMWCDLVEKKSVGEIKIDSFPAEQLGKYRGMFSDVVYGFLEAGLLPLSPEFDKRLQVGYLVGLAESWEEGCAIYGKDGWMFKLIEPILEKIGVKPLGFFHMGMDGLGSIKGPVYLPEDINNLGLKVRTWNPAGRLFFQEMGVQTVDIALSELFTSLQTGLVHAQDNAPLLTYNYLRDVTKYYTVTEHLFEPLVLLVNLDLWNKLPENFKIIIQEAADEALKWGNQKSKKISESYLLKMENEGTQIIRLSQEQKNIWLKHAVQSWDKFEELIGTEIMDLVRSRVKEKDEEARD